jgi:uncharacterized GH25 family protein
MNLASFRLVTAFLGLAVLPAKVTAHEFWLSPQSYEVAVGEPLLTDIRVGQKFNATAFAYIDFNIVRFDLIQNGVVTPVKGRMGDIPALQMAAPGEGLVTIVHETTPSLLTWSEWEKFESFVTHKDLKGTLEAHEAKGLPQTGFKETYRRFGKALIKVGSGEGQDVETGMLTEIVALANPYRDDVTAGLPVRLLYQQAPRADAQIEIFAKAADGTVTITTTRTDGDGKAMIPVTPGVEYMLDAVVMLPLQGAAEGEAVFESLWANLTFRIPDQN